MTLFHSRRAWLARTGALLAVTSLAGRGALAAPTETMAERSDLAALFENAGLRGTFALHEPRSGKLTVVDAARAARRFVPASTFKIPNSLIALETGAVRSLDEVLPYGGKPQEFKQWEKDMNLRDAIRVSNVPVYQEVARRIGLASMKDALVRLDYGNRSIGSVVDRFWLDGPLEISAIEQARFLSRLALGQLPFSARNQASVREITRLETLPDGSSLHGKTGWLFHAKPQIGWWVGWVQRAPGDVASFALNIDVLRGDADLSQRLPVGRAMLQALGALPAAARG